MSLVPVICSRCGASLSVDDKNTTAICEYCRTAFVVESAVAQMQANINNENVLPEFVIRAGILLRYYGSDTEVVVPDEVLRLKAEHSTTIF